ncbi:MAG: hydrolase [Anaerocolumna sp.]|jgi:hypothetical protein|nr:hydrolase [Anaerocolumna sp.]
MAIRNAAKAIILHNDSILINRCITKNGEVYFELPGGGQNQFETMEVINWRSIQKRNSKNMKNLI